MAGSADFNRFGHLDLSEEEQAKKPRQQDSKDGGGFLKGVFPEFFGSGKTSPKQSKKAAQEQQPVVKRQPTLPQSFGLSNQKPAEMDEHHANQQADSDDDQYHGWVDVGKPEVVPDETNQGRQASQISHHRRHLGGSQSDPMSPQSTTYGNLLVDSHQIEGVYIKKKHCMNTLEAEDRGIESINVDRPDSESERKEVDRLKQRVGELEHHLNVLHEHSKKQSRTIFKLMIKEEAFGVEMQEEQIQSYEGLIQELEERQDHLQKELSKARSELEIVTKYKESIENELKPLKEEAFRAANENEELRAKVVQFSESLEAKNQLQRDVYKLENEKAELKDQLEAAQAQVVIFETDFADERRDREVAHSKLADLEMELTLQKGLDRDSYWREEARRLRTQLQEAEQHLTDLMSSQEDYPAKEAQVELLRKSLEEKTKELDKMTKRVNKLEEDAKSKKKKKKSSDTATPQESVDARNLARVEQLYNDASLELQEMHKELATWQARYTQLENQNRELELRVKALKANFKEQKRHQSGATTSGDPSQVSHQLQMQLHDRGQTRDIQSGEFTNDGRAVPNLPIRAAALPLQTNTIPEFDEVTSDSASSRNHPQRTLRSFHSDALPKSNPSGSSTMSQEECYSGNLPHVPASTIPGNQYPQGQVGGSVIDQLQFQQFLHPSGVIPGVIPQIQGEFEVRSLGQHQSSTSAKKSLFELEEKKKAVEIERQQKLAVLESEEKAVITKLIEDLELSHDRINHLDMVLVQRNKEITQLQNEVFLLHNDIEAKAKLEMDLKSTIALLNQKSLSAIESEKELEARMEVLETEKQKAISELESEKQSAAAAVQEITVSLEAEKHEKSNLQDALNKTLHQSEKMHKQSLAAIEHLQEQIKWLNKTLLLWHQTPHGHKTGDQLKHFVIQEDSEPFKYGAIVAAGCFGAVHSSTIGDIRCIAKRIHDILVGRGGQQGVSEKDKMAILANFKRECTILSTARHRNVVQFMGVHYGNEEYDISLIMEDLPTDLERFLSAYREENDHQDGFKLPLSFQVSFLSDIASGLLYLHSQSIVHRDLNSGNVLLTADLQAKIADLGVSKLHQDKKWFQKLTQAPGASGYMPPEAVAKKPVYDEKIDIFSFGVLSLYIATQNFPEILEEHVPDEIHHKGEGEIFKRQEWVDALKTQQHPFYDLVWQCLLDKQRRPQTTDVVEIVRRMREDHQCTIKETLNVFAHFHDLID